MAEREQPVVAPRPLYGSLPHPGAPHQDNLIATILDCDEHNRREWLNLDRIARFQGFDPGEFRARFAEMETAWSLRPREYGGDGK